MFYEANASSSACRLWRLFQVETGAPPSMCDINIIQINRPKVKWANQHNAGNLLIFC